MLHHLSLVQTLNLSSEAPEPRGQLPPPPALCSRGQLCPFLITIELFYHANNFASDVRNVINESELIVAGRHWSMIGKFICAIVKYNKTNYTTSWLSIRQRDNS